MNIMLIRRTLPAQALWLPAGLPRVHHPWARCEHARAAPRTSLNGVEDVAGSRSRGLSNGDFELFVRPPPLKSP
jgi:hypothetical protein